MDTNFLDDEVNLKVWMLIAAPAAVCFISCCFCRCITKM